MRLFRSLFSEPTTTFLQLQALHQQDAATGKEYTQRTLMTASALEVAPKPVTFGSGWKLGEYGDGVYIERPNTTRIISEEALSGVARTLSLS